MEIKRDQNIMVCVTSPRTCDRLVQRGMDRSGGGQLHVVHCVQTGRHFMNTVYEADAIEYLFTAAQLAGAELSLLREDDVESALVQYAKEQDIGLIIMGVRPPQERGGGEEMYLRLQRRLPGVEFDILE